jgi:N-acetylneuraminic acid mutarotase
MIVWGGYGDSGYLNTGDRYNPSTDSWTATTTTNAPAARYKHSAIWTGSEMIVWGGLNGGYVTTGGRYNPATDSWIATSTFNAPSAREAQTAVWTGSEMIVWGGSYFDGSNHFYLNTGGKYNPGMDSWTATSTTNVPSGRTDHTAVWTGSEMIVWGGDNGDSYFNTGGRYNPSMDSWTATSNNNAPSGRDLPTAVWTGSEMIIWGGVNLSGQLNTGGRYNPSTDSWTATTTNNAPTARTYHTALWTGNEMIVWGGNGGDYGFPTSSGARYNPSMDIWRTTSTINAPSARVDHTAVWTGSEMIVWGGDYDGYVFNTNGRYCAQLSDTGPPVVTTNPATNITSLSATLNGSLNPNGLPTTVYFEYGTTTSYGRTTPAQNQTGNTLRNISANAGYNISANTTYHFRIVATNSYGTRRGGDRIFTTLSQTGPPLVTTNPATNVATFSATLNGSTDPHGLTTNVYFQYGPTTSYGSTTPVQAQAGNRFLDISANISGLSAHTTYHFRVVATNSAGTRYGSDMTFTTLSPTGPPVVITNLATFIGSVSANLNGSLDPHGLTTTVYFQYGTTTSYGLTTPVQSRTGNTYRNIAANIHGLTASTTYHFRIAATNSAGTRYGGDRTFTTLSPTGPPAVFTNPATNVAISSATLNCSLDPHGLMTSVFFQYGTSLPYGSTTATQTQSGNTYRNVAANVGSLSAGTTYHFRSVASNSAGVKISSDRVFTTP